MNATQLPSLSVIIPVYNSLAETKACLQSLFQTESANRTTARIWIIEDCSSDPAVRTFLQTLQHPHLQVVYNEQNLGFVASVNRGMQLAEQDDVILLNSDTEVAHDWLDRLQERAYRAANIATVTPFSNNATICSYPFTCQDNPLPQGWTASQLDQLFQANPPADITLPTGIGFCMFIKRKAIEQIGLFDAETFGRGYGEECDFCQRAIQQGWRNVLAENVFVYHKGGASFAMDSNPKSLAAQQILDQRYPQYHAQVAEHIHQDPARSIRRGVLLNSIAQHPLPRVLQIHHGIGGGVGKHLQELQEFYADQLLFLYLAPTQTAGEVLLQLGLNQPTTRWNLPQEYDAFLQLLRDLGVSHVHYQHFMGLPPRIWGLPQDLQVPYDITLHDYYALNGNPTLTDIRGRYCCDQADQCDALCAEHYPLPPGVTVQQWRQNYQQLFQPARYVITPSEDCAQRYRTAFPQQKFTAAWHPEAEIAEYPLLQAIREKKTYRIAVLGAISREKGADVLEAVALQAKARSLPFEFHLVGYAYRVLDGVVTHGGFPEGEALTRLLKINADLVWYPAQWPETYSYTLSTALEAGLPVLASRLGAFPERLQGRSQSLMLPWLATEDVWLDGFFSLIGGVAETSKQTPLVSGDFYRNYYAQQVIARHGNLQRNWQDWHHMLHQRWSNKTPQLTTGDRLLRLLVWLRNLPIFRRVARVIPYRWQRAIKHKLSRKALHEL